MSDTETEILPQTRLQSSIEYMDWTYRSTQTVSLKRYLKKQDQIYFEFLKSKYLLFKLCYGTKENLNLIKILMIFQTINKFFRHNKAILNLYKYILNDKIGES